MYMIPIDINVSRSTVKVKSHVSLPHLLQRITLERFAQEDSNLEGGKSMMSRWSLLRFRLVGQRSRLKVKPSYLEGVLVFENFFYIGLVIISFIHPAKSKRRRSDSVL